MISSTHLAKVIPVGYAVCRLIVFPSAHGPTLSSRLFAGSALFTFMMPVIISGAALAHRCTDAFIRFAGVLAGRNRLMSETSNIVDYRAMAPFDTTPAKCSQTTLDHATVKSPFARPG